MFVLQQEVCSRMSRPELFVPETLESLSWLLKTGLCVGVWVGDQLVAYSILRYCGEDEHNYANVLGVPRDEWKYWANAESSVVHPDYRGNGLQRRTIAVAEQWRDPSIIGLGATVSPDNPFSLSNVQAAGFTIARRCEMYGGRDRFVLQRRLMPLPGTYRHFKGRPYQVLQIAKHSETQEPMVVYRALYGEREVWVRPASMWFERVERDGYSGPRFYWSPV